MDTFAGRLAPMPARSFGLRRSPPIPLAPQRPPVPLPAAWQAWRAAHALATRLATALQREVLALGPRGIVALAACSGLFLHLGQSLALAWRRRQRRTRAQRRTAAVRAILFSDASATFVRLLAYVGALTIIGFGAMRFADSAPVTFQAPVAPALEWISVRKPFPAFSLPMAELADAQVYGMRRHAWGGGRQDSLRWGDIDAQGPHLLVEVYRPGIEAVHFGSAEEQIAARLDGLERDSVKAAGELETKFGPLPLVEFSLGAGRHCLGFARAYEDPALQIVGWHCAAGAVPAARDLAACALDRLTLLSAGSEPKVREFFSRAELKRNFCGQRSHLIAPTPKLGPSSPPWEPKLRGRVAAR